MPTFELRLANGDPADPPILRTNAPRWNPRDVIPLRSGKGLRVIAVHAAEPVLVVEDGC